MRVEKLGGLTVRLTSGTDKRAGQWSVGGAAPWIRRAGDDLVPLSEYLDAPAGTRSLSRSADSHPDGLWRFACLVDDRHGPYQSGSSGGQGQDMSGEIPRGLPEARARMKGVLDEIRTTLGADPARTVLGGFSRGAMLSCDALLHSTQPYAGLVQLSGTLVAKQEWAPLLTKRKGLPPFKTMARRIPFCRSVWPSSLRDEFLQAGVTVEWQPFRGGHEIPEPVLRKLSSFLVKTIR